MMKKIEIFFRRLLLNLLLITSKRRTSSEKPIINSSSNVLFIRLNRIGDALVTTPLLTQIKNQIGCKIYVLADVKNHFIFNRCRAVNETFIYQKGLKGLSKIKSLIKEKNIDTLVDLHDDVSFSVSHLIKNIKGKQILGFKKKNEKLYTHTVTRLDSTKHHIVERTLELSKLFGLKPEYESAKINYSFRPESIKYAEEQLQKFKDKFLLGINITAGSEARFWGKEKFKQLIEIINNYQIDYVLFTTKEYFEIAREITSEKNIFPPSEDFDIFAAGISKLNMLFTPDTSIVHIASMMKIPVFGLYVKYKTNDMIWSPYNTEFESVITEEPTLKNVTFDDVKNKFIPFLEKHLNA